jgi:carbamoyl-phosphate synthase small subunit
MNMIDGQLVLSSGERFLGQIPANQSGVCFGEVVFNTGMVGYVEALTDPSYAGQILVFTYPLIGNYGVSDVSTWESHKIQVTGVVVSEMAESFSNANATMSLQSWLEQQKIPYITNIDTRALTKRLRTAGVAPGAIASMQEKPEKFSQNDLINWMEQVSVPTPINYGEGEKLIIAIDCGMKENILRNLLDFPIKIKRVPYNYDFTDEHFDGVFISNGPGDPQCCIETIKIVKKVLEKKKPVFGICLGTQLMALAIGAQTYKLSFGHRSQNQPCLEIASQRYFLTSQNHGYAIDEATLPSDWCVSFRNINDQTVAGIEHKELPFFSVQFHPEAAPGPLDTQWLFEKFYRML